MIEAREFYEALQDAVNMALAGEMPYVGEPGFITWEEVEVLNELLPTVTPQELIDRILRSDEEDEEDEETSQDYVSVPEGLLEEAQEMYEEYLKLIEKDDPEAPGAMQDFLQSAVGAISEAGAFDLSPSLHYD